MSSVTSSLIDALGHNPVSEELFVRFRNGRLYAYKGVADEVFARLMESDSPGRFFRERILGNYEFLQLEP